MDEQFSYHNQLDEISSQLSTLGMILQRININLESINNNSQDLFQLQEINFEWMREILTKGMDGLAKTDNIQKG